MPRTRLVLTRWASLVACGTLSAALWMSLFGPARSLLGPVIDHAASVPPGVLVSSLLVFASVGIWHWGHGRWLAFLGVRHFWGYPPLWVAALVACAILVAHSVAMAGWDPIEELGSISLWALLQVPWWLWLPLTLAVVAEVVTTYHADVARPARARPSVRGSQLLGITEWLRDDHEIERPEDDRFGHDLVARRIAARLMAEDTAAPTMAVVGPLGSGKSTVRALVSYHLKGHPSVVFASISLWPFDSAEAASVGVLRTVIRALGERVNTLALSRLSEQYVSLIEGVGGRWSSIAPFLLREPQPELLLKDLAAVATAAGIRLALWVEDLERFTGADRLSPSEATSREAERLGPILSLLHLLDRNESICVIVADTSLRSRLDVGKIARFVENPPRISESSACRAVDILRAACLAEDFIDPAAVSYRARLSLSHGNDSKEARTWNMDGARPRIHDAVAILLGVPRAFKTALRLSLESWESLRGEIDFDSVLVASVIRTARPEIFSLIDENIDRFRGGFRDPLAASLAGGAAPTHPVLNRLEEMLRREPDERTQSALRVLIEFVFPAVRVEDWTGDSYVDCPQGLGVARHADYWQRYLTLQPIAANDSDQQVLREIHAWRERRPNEFVRRLESGLEAERVESFVGQFSGAELCRLLREYCSFFAPRSAAEWGDAAHPPGVTSIWRMMHRRTPQGDLLAQALRLALQECIPVNLTMVESMLLFFASDGGGVSPLMDSAARSDIQELVRTELVRTFPLGSGRKLIEATHECSPFAVYQVCWGIDAIRSRPDRGLPFNDWPVFASVLLEAAELDPDRGIPIIVPFVVRSGGWVLDRNQSIESDAGPGLSYVAHFDEVQARTLFDFDRLLALLRSTEPPPRLNPQIAAMCDAARVAALAGSDGKSPKSPDE